MFNHEQEERISEAELERMMDMFGGPAKLGSELRSASDVEKLLGSGLQVAAYLYLLHALSRPLISGWLSAAAGRGPSSGTDASGTTLGPEESTRAWRFAKVLAKAREVFGSQEEAERWLESPAIGLDQRRRPIDILATSEGAKEVEDLLGRIEYGVYI